MNIPKLAENQFAVGQAEYNTGHVLNKDNSLFINGGDINEVYEILDSYLQAREYVIKKVQNNPSIECWIIDTNGKTVFAYDKNGERELKL